MKPLVGLALMHEQEFLRAALSLFAADEVELLEWSFDTILYEKYKPEWLHQLLREYSSKGRLIGHGVRYSLLDAKWTRRQSGWLNKLRKEVNRYPYQHITEHFGFMTSSDFHKGAPLPVPFNKHSLRIGIDRIKRLKDAIGSLPLGIENLAFSFSAADVKEQGAFLAELIRPVDGFLILDLHNVYCQAENFKIDILEIIRSYPLDKVREIHISGGSWKNSIYSKEIKKVRRDTHDERVPEQLFKILPDVLSLCPNIAYVIFERLGNSLQEEEEQEQFRKDFRRIKSIVHRSSPDKKASTVSERSIPYSKAPLNDLSLYKEQRFLSKTILDAGDPVEALFRLKKEELKYWDVDQWNSSMLETAMSIAKKWDL
jgi:uncharacterized protein (UPF0276 family)